jgi:vacuolar-type H+-ATPase subunit I/STV1
MTAQNEEKNKQLTHTRSCAGLNPTEDCTCCLKERVEAQDYLTLLTAWQKRCTESEVQLSESQKREAEFLERITTLCAQSFDTDKELESEQKWASDYKQQLDDANKTIEDLRTRLSGQTCYVPPEFQAEMDELKRKLKDCQDNLAARMFVRPIDVDQMVTNFLGWKLPEHFHPDAGVSFTPEYNIGTPYQRKHEPVGTNLFDADQARKMILDILPKSEVSTDRLREIIATERAAAQNEGEGK